MIMWLSDGNTIAYASLKCQSYSETTIQFPWFRYKKIIPKTTELK